MERLSVCEEEVYLEICWMSEPPALEDVRSAVNRLGHEWKPQTVSTFLNRLVKKRYLSMWKKGRYYYYKPDKVVLLQQQINMEKTVDVEYTS